ncbi:MAG: GyrI-like domain-containing protein [Bacillota bacterium]
MFERLFAQLFRWAGPRNLLNPETRSVVIYHDNPEITDKARLRISVCISVPPDTEVDGEIGKMVIPAGKYALARYYRLAPNAGWAGRRGPPWPVARG